MSERIERLEVKNIMESSFGEYAKSIIQDRAIPDARDGLKPVQRRIIYAMNEDGNTFDKPYKKSINGVAVTMKSYHPHGDASIYDAMIHMGQWWKTNMMMVDVQGNEGSIDGDGPAASRYVEARLSKNATLLTGDLPFETIDKIPNFDDTKMEPTVLPVQFPLCLVMGSTGIAAGYATEIPPFNFNEVVSACVERLKNKKMKYSDLFKIIKGPDFPTGGYIIGTKDVEKAMETGRGKIVNSSTYKIEHTKKCNQIVITEIPFDTVKQDIVKSVISLNKDFILECRDESDKDGIRIVIDIDKNVDINTALDYILKNTNFRKNYNFNMVAIVNRTPKQCGVLDIIDCWIEFRKDVLVRKHRFLLNQYKNRLEIVEGMIKAVSIMDEVIATIRKSTDRTDVIKNLELKFSFSNLQAEAIANMRLYRLSNSDIVELQKEKDELLKQISASKKIVSSDKEVTKKIISELEKINKEYVTPRKTKIVDKEISNAVDESKLIQNEDVFVTVSSHGYIKRMASKRSNDEQTCKSDDFIIWSGIINSHDRVNMLTDLGGYLTLTVHKIPECKPSEIGTHISKFVKCDNHKIITVGSGRMIAWTRDGMVKTFDTKDFVEVTKMVKIPVYFKTDSCVMVAEPITKGKIVTVTKSNINYYSIDEITETSLSSGGLAACKVKEGDELVMLKQVSDSDKIKIGKKSMPVSELKPTHRGYTGTPIK